LENFGGINKQFIENVRNGFDFDALDISSAVPMASFDDAVALEDAADMFVLTVELEELTATLEFDSSEMTDDERTEIERRILELDEKIRSMQKSSESTGLPTTTCGPKAVIETTLPQGSNASKKMAKKSD
jgi:hypothetical protein